MDTSPLAPPALTPSTIVHLEGADALEVLHRISTQRLTDLQPGEARATLFCDFRGRLLHRAVVTRVADGSLWLLAEDAATIPLAAYIDRNVFRERVTIADHAADFRVEGLDAPPVDGPSLVEAEGRPLRVRDGQVELVVRPASDPATGDTRERERERIRQGRAAHGREIVEAFHPFEVGLGADVHLDKGCFTGQETLMRLITYASVRRGLVGVRGRGAAPAVAADVLDGGEKAGVLTSAIAGESDRWTGLAVVVHGSAEPGRALTVAGQPLDAPVHRFPAPRPRGRG